MKIILGLLLIATVIAVMSASIHGLILAFSASIILGIIVLIIEPMPLIFGAVYWLTGVDLAQKIIDALT